ncbi:RNA polymerase sigma factor [Micromonospora sp. NBC_00617]|uniref:RNA polymerase sigma factor n=1 Tax=Micromonospora sp. NBC_00617 TaxID=2903587 RepID=UPI00386B374C
MGCRAGRHGPARLGRVRPGADTPTGSGAGGLSTARPGLGERGLAEETLQDTFVAVWRGADRFEHRSAVRTWLFGICRRQALKRLRGRQPQTAPAEWAEGVPSTDPSPEAVVIARADAAAVAGALVTLSVQHREVLDLAFGARLSQTDIAEVLGVPLGTVKSRLFHARAVLARALPAEVERTAG